MINDDEEHFKKHLHKMNPDIRALNLNKVICAVRDQFKSKVDYVFLLVPVSRLSFGQINVLYDEISKQKIPFHYFITCVVGMSINWFQQLFFVKKVTNFLTILKIIYRMSRMINMVVDDSVNEEAILNTTTLEHIIKIAIMYKLEMIDLYRIISRIKHQYTTIYHRIEFTEENFEEIVRTYLEKKKT